MGDEQIKIDVREALRDIALLKGGLADLRGQMGQTRQTGEKAFSGIGASAIKEAGDINLLRKKYAEVQQAAKELREALKTAYDPRAISTYTKALGQAEAGLKKIENGAHAAGISLKDTGKQAESTGASIRNIFLGSFAANTLTGALDTVLSVLKAGTEQALKFEQGLADLSALTGIKGADLDGLEQIVRKLQVIQVGAEKIVTTGPEITRALALVGGAAPELLKNADALAKVTEQAIILSKTSELNLEQSVKAVTTAMGQFNFEAAEGGRIINAYAAASKAGSIEVPRLTRELADVGQTANLTGVSFEETLGAIELFGKAKIPEGRIGVQLRNIFSIMADAKGATKEAQEAYKKFGIDTDLISDKTRSFADRLKELGKLNGDIPAITTIFGLQNQGGAAILSTQADVLIKELVPAIKGTNEALIQAAIRSDTASSSIKNLKNDALNDLGGAFSSSSGPIKFLADGLGFLIEKFGIVSAVVKAFFLGPVIAQLEAASALIDRITGRGRNLNPGADNRTSLDPFATSGNPRADIEGKIREAQQKSLAAQIKLNEARELAGQIEDKNAKLAETAANKAKARQREREAELREVEAYNKRLAELNLQKLDPKSEAFAVAKENLRFADQLAEFKKFNLSTEEIELLHQANLFEIRIDFENKRVQAEQASAKRLLDLYEKGVKDIEDAEKKKTDAIQKEIDTQRSIGDARIDVQEEVNNGYIIALEKAGADEQRVKEEQKRLDLEIQQARLENELKFQLAFLEATDAGDTARLDATLAQIDKIRQQLKNVAAEGLPDAGTGKKKSFLESLFPDFSGDELDKLKAGLDDAKNALFGFLQETSDARLEAADREIEAAEKKVEAAQAIVDEEKKIADQGYANNLETAEKNLAAAKAQEERAIQQKQDAQRKQVQLDTVTQGIALVTSSANIFRALSPLGPIGIGLAIATIATMFGAFIAARNRAAQAIKFREGGPVKGPSHERGGVPIEAEGGEFVTSRRATAQHFNLLEAVNKRDDPALDRWALGRVAKLDRVAVGQAIGEGKGSTTVIVQTKEDRKAHDLLRAIRDKRQPPVTTVEGNYSVTRMNGKTIRKRL